jgi:hypothetical protein
MYFMVYWNHEDGNSAKIFFSIDLLLQVCETTNSATYGSMHFEDTTNIGVHEYMYFHRHSIHKLVLHNKTY